ncbi:MAG TPA: xanthine dehydrogenase family protein molybdopterin-binding subunit [Anaerolineales bacterium]|nr:xanthine dehydrogenase family protein molybdopterin-binding subunit [Anaerolineales bacterium]
MSRIPLVRSQAVDKVTGSSLYPGDLHMDGQVYMQVLFARRAHARILRIDSSAALHLPGVISVLTARDVPVNRYGIEIPDQPLLCGDVARFYGDRIALVVAESEEIADRAVDLIRVGFEDLPILDDPLAALSPGAPLLHPESPDNVLVAYQIEQGDVEAGFARADLILDETYRTGSQEHAYLQPDAGLAWIDEAGRVTVMSAGQWAHDDRRQIAHCLDLPESSVRVLYANIGGAFGGREDLHIQVCLALAALKVRRPVKAVWSREETTIGHPKRHPMIIRHKWGVSRQGKLIAQQIEILADVGAYASTSASVLSTTVMMCSGPYESEHVKVNARGVFTNNLVGGAFRGFGAPQAVFAAEVQMGRLARMLNIDPVELRLRNLIKENSRLATIGSVPPCVTVRETLQAAAFSAGWSKKEGSWVAPALAPASDPNQRRGIGIAVGWKPVGYSLGWQEEASVEVEIQGAIEIESVRVSAPAAEVGQGSHTTICRLVASTLEIPAERVHLCPVDTDGAPSVGPASASRTTLVVGNAALGAAEAALKAWKNEERPATASYTYRAPKTFNFPDLTQAQNATRAATIAVGYVAQAAAIGVDVETGQITIHRLVSAHDVGKAIHPQAVEGQVQGGAIQGLGWATMEDFIVTHGQVLTSELSTYLIPTVLDVPADFETIVLETPSPTGPLGAIGIGEMSLLAVAPAICEALYEATGMWSNEIPLTPERVWRLLQKSTVSR